VLAGNAYLVGEEGPEVVTFGSDGYVHNARDTEAMMTTGQRAMAWQGMGVSPKAARRAGRVRCGSVNAGGGRLRPARRRGQQPGHPGPGVRRRPRTDGRGRRSGVGDQPRVRAVRICRCGSVGALGEPHPLANAGSDAHPVAAALAGEHLIAGLDRDPNLLRGGDEVVRDDGPVAATTLPVAVLDQTAGEVGCCFISAWRYQVVSASPADIRNEFKRSAGVSHPNVILGRPLSISAISSSWTCV
jgi:hypothetical protein